MLEKIKRWLTNPKPNEVWYYGGTEVVIKEVQGDGVVVWNKTVYAFIRMDKKYFKKHYRRIK